MNTKSEIVKSHIQNAGSKFVSVTFIKKTTGEERTITFNPKEGCNLVSGNRAEATQKRKANNPNLINVVDSSIANREEDRRKGWRSFSSETVISMKVGGKQINLGDSL